jgi:hypothetical protein
MTASSRLRAICALVPILALAAAGCGDDLASSCPRGRPITMARALTSTTVVLTFGCRLDSDTAGEVGRYAVGDYTVTPPTSLQVSGTAVEGDRVTLTTAKQTALRTYTLRVEGVEDDDGNSLSASVNFTGVGQSDAAMVTFQVDDRYAAGLKQVWLLTSVDPLTGVFSHFTHRVPLADADGDHLFEAKLQVAVDPSRTATTTDDRLGAQHMAYTARAVDAQNRPLSALVPFEVGDGAAKTVKVPLLSVPAPPPPEGLVSVTFKVDDRPARALSKPTLRGSFDANGIFDAQFPSTIALSDKDGDDVWEGTAKVRIAPKRALGGVKAETKPYSVYLVEGSSAYSGRSAEFAVPDEKPVSATILVGDSKLIPVTFRVDIASSWLDTDGANKGLYKGEAIYLTGEFGVAEDAFGQNATDSFSGGENVVLQMVERKDHPGVWERTIFLPPNRPYGWKVLRCPLDKGCTQLNKKVSSSGRAFPTVMKNLITELCDAGKKSWTDTACKGPRLIDPRKLTQVVTGQGTLDYSGAKIHIGNGGGIKDQKDPAGTPSKALMFKQEVPDLVVDVKDKPLQTPVYVVGTWRDVNIPGSPADIVASGSVIELTKTDYDAGMIGLPPPSYTLPPPSKPSPFVMNGKLEGTATLVAGGAGGGMPLYMAISGSHLYLATDDAGEGSDNFIVISATKPGSPRPAPWGKAGTVAFAGKTLFLADENDSGYAAWFQLGSPDTLLEAAGGNQSGGKLGVATAATNGGYLEGTLDLAALFGSVPKVVYVATAPWDTANAGKLYSAAQTPKTKDGNGNIDAAEILKVSLPQLKVQP